MCSFTDDNTGRYEVVDVSDGEVIDRQVDRESVQKEVDDLNALFGEDVFIVRELVNA